VGGAGVGEGGEGEADEVAGWDGDGGGPEG